MFLLGWRVFPCREKGLFLIVAGGAGKIQGYPWGAEGVCRKRMIRKTTQAEG
jgi:hypothetical protein